MLTGSSVLSEWQGLDGTDVAAQVGGLGRVHVAFQKLGTLQYGVWDGIAFEATTITPPDGAAVFLTPRMGVGSDDTARILYAAGIGEAISYRLVNIHDGTLLHEVLDPNVGTAVIGPGLAVRENRIAGVWGKSGAVIYASQRDSTWELERLPGDGLSPVGLSSALGSGSDRHVSFISSNSMEVRYAFSADYDRIWRLETIGTTLGANAPRHTSLFVGDTGSAHMAFTANGLTYARKDGDTWRHEEADPASSGSHSSLVVDRCSNVLILYLDVNTRELKMATKLASAWKIHVIAILPGSADTQSALAMSADGQFNVFWFEHERSGEGINRIRRASGAVVP